MNENFPQCHEYHVQVNGCVEAHADFLGEAIAIAHHLKAQNRGLVAIVDEIDHSLVLGWWLITCEALPSQWWYCQHR